MSSAPSSRYADVFRRAVDASHQDRLTLDDFDEVLFIGDFTASFGLRAHPIAARLANFGGVVVSGLSPAKRARIGAALAVPGLYRFVGFDDLARGSAASRTLVLDFNDGLAGKLFPAALQRSGVVVRDHLWAMDRLGLAHTYLPVREERAAIVADLDRLLTVMDRLRDDLSVRTLAARILALVTLDRAPLLEVNSPIGVFAPGPASGRALVVRERETYVDVGAAHGDTVAEFFNHAGGRYRAIHAFEPDPVNFAALQRLCSLMPEAHCHHGGLGDRAGEIAFQEMPENRFGSNFVTAGAGTAAASRVRVWRLDDLLEEASVIKIDVEGYEPKVLAGAAGVIARHRPNLHVSAYHYPSDLPQIVEIVERIHGYRHVAVRHSGANLYDTNLLFSDDQPFH